MHHSSISDPPQTGGRLGPAVLGLIGLCCLVELVLIGADLGFVGSPRWRGLAYQNGAFWAGLLRNWRPNYSLQPYLMFVTYAFLHGGLWHLLGNMLALFALGDIVRRRVGQGGFLAIYVVSALGGGAGFGLLTSSPSPMVGASGALFGLVAAWKYWEWVDRRREGHSLWPVWRSILWLVALNVALWIALDGLLAWETHLGGFIAGWCSAAFLSRCGRG